MSKFNLKLLLKIVAGLIGVVVRVLTDPDINDDDLLNLDSHA